MYQEQEHYSQEIWSSTLMSSLLNYWQSYFINSLQWIFQCETGYRKKYSNTFADSIAININWWQNRAAKISATFWDSPVKTENQFFGPRGPLLLYFPQWTRSFVSSFVNSPISSPPSLQGWALILVLGHSQEWKPQIPRFPCLIFENILEYLNISVCLVKLMLLTNFLVSITLVRSK